MSMRCGRCGSNRDEKARIKVLESDNNRLKAENERVRRNNAELQERLAVVLGEVDD